MNTTAKPWLGVLGLAFATLGIACAAEPIDEGVDRSASRVTASRPARSADDDNRADSQGSSSSSSSSGSPGTAPPKGTGGMNDACAELDRCCPDVIDERERLDCRYAVAVGDAEGCAGYFYMCPSGGDDTGSKGK